MCLPALQLCRALQMRHEACEQAAAVGAAHDIFDVVFRMRHHAEHIAAGLTMPAIDCAAPLMLWVSPISPLAEQ